MNTNLIAPIRKIWKEPIWSWGFRLAVSVCVPLSYGVFTGNLQEVFWIAIAAQSTAFIELRGNLGLIARILLSGALLSVLFCIIGSLAGNVLIIHFVMMFVVGSFSTLFKNLGERGMGLALSVYIFYIITSSYPTTNIFELYERCRLVFLGGLWTLFVALIWMLVEKQGKPFRKSVSEVFHQMAMLCSKARSGFGGEGVFVPLRQLYLQENKVREALNTSVSLFGTSGDADKEIQNRRQLEQVRKAASLIHIHLLEIIELCNKLKSQRKVGQTDIHIHSILRIWEQICEMMSDYMYTLKVEDKMLLQSRLERLKSITTVISEDLASYPEVKDSFESILHLSARTARLAERIIDILAGSKEKRVYRSYTLSKTMSILHPKQFSNEFASLFKLDKSITKYAVRVGLGTTIGMVIGYYLFPSYGYWLPFTTIIVAQPYIGATVKRGLERSLGTFLGVLTGFLFFQLPHAHIWNIMIVFVCSIMCIYFLRKNYSVSSFFVTISLLGLLSVNQHNDENILVIRLVCTVIGSAISMLMGFLFISTWDVSMMPKHFAKAIVANYEYLLHSPLLYHDQENWLRYKRLSESANAVVYDSYTRWLSEPTLKKDRALIGKYFTMIAHNIRITKEQNNINAEWEQNKNILNNSAELQLFKECHALYQDIIGLLEENLEEHVEFKAFIPVTSNAISPLQEVSINKMVLELKALKKNIEESVRGSR